MTTRHDDRIGFIGGGNMARAIAGGLLESGFAAEDMLVAEPLAEARRELRESLPGVHVSDSNEDVAAGAGCLVLAVKPQVLPQVCRQLADTVQSSRPLVVSIAAGVRSDDIERWLGGRLAVVRIMPNQPALLGLGVSGLYANARTDAGQRDRAAQVIGAVGEVVTVTDEADMDAVTAVSGSGPAYFFLLIEALASTAVDLGLDARAARTLAVETAKGAAALAAAETADMAALIARVRSPGGTTAAALERLDEANVRAIFAGAITAARDRAVALADAAHEDDSDQGL